MTTIVPQSLRVRAACANSMPQLAQANDERVSFDTHTPVLLDPID